MTVLHTSHAPKGEKCFGQWICNLVTDKFIFVWFKEMESLCEPDWHRRG